MKYKNTKERLCANAKIHYYKYHDNELKRSNKYYQKNKEKINKRIAEYNKLRYKNDSLIKLKCCLRSRIYSIFKKAGHEKQNISTNLLDIKFEIVKIYIEKQFKKNMTWNNYGQWHIDHIIPLSSAKTKKELIELCHYTNLQPLWRIENKLKNNKIPNVQLKLTI